MNSQEQIISAPVVDQIDKKDASPVKPVKMQTRKMSNQSRASKASAATDNAEEGDASQEAAGEEAKKEESPVEASQAVTDQTKTNELAETIKPEETVEKTEEAEAISPQPTLAVTVGTEGNECPCCREIDPFNLLVNMMCTTEVDDGSRPVESKEDQMILKYLAMVAHDAAVKRRNSDLVEATVSEEKAATPDNRLSIASKASVAWVIPAEEGLEEIALGTSLKEQIETKKASRDHKNLHEAQEEVKQEQPSAIEEEKAQSPQEHEVEKAVVELAPTISAQASAKSSKKRPISELGEVPEDAAAVSAKSSKRRKVQMQGPKWTSETGSKDLSKSVCVVISMESKQAAAELDALSLAEKKPSQDSDLKISPEELSEHLD